MTDARDELAELIREYPTDPAGAADAILAAGWARTTCGHRSPFDDPCAEPVGHSGDHRTANRLRGWANLSFTWSPGDDITEELVAELKEAGWRAPQSIPIPSPDPGDEYECQHDGWFTEVDNGATYTRQCSECGERVTLTKELPEPPPYCG